ncbi:MAG: response regulator [Magnetococcales bacterium]|nr:response regulator [Magnetococcales bacterium]
MTTVPPVCASSDTPNILRILVVDDEEADAATLRRHLKRGLGEQSHVLTHAFSYTEALIDLEEQGFDLCFFDHHLGHRTGLELLQEARARGFEMPVIFLTGFGDEETAVTLMKSGAVDYLAKERLSPEILVRSVRYALELTQSEQRRRRAEKALIEKSIHLDNVLRSATDLAIITTDLDFVIRYCNPKTTELLGLPHASAMGRSVHDIHHTLAVQESAVVAGIARVRQQGEHRFEIQTENQGGLHFLDARASGVLDEHQHLVGYCLTVRDVTERRTLLHDLEQAAQKAETANQAKSAFLAAMSHDIRTPMNTIIGICDLLALSTPGAEEQEYIERMQRAGEALLSLLNDILDFSKIEAGQLQLENTTFDLPELMANALEILRFKAEKKGLTLTLHIQEEPPRLVRGDPDRLRQILLNLLGNAVKFTEHGTVTLELSRTQPGWVALTVCDTGIGIPSEKLSDIFQPFTQAEASTTKRFGGTGLGLSICRQLSQKMGGEIRVESAIGAGSLFQVTLPLPDADPLAPSDPAPAQTPTETADGMQKRKLNILLADDTEENHFLLEAFLRKTPHTLESSSDGAECLAKFRKGRYDLVLMDIQMPVMDGLDATRHIRAWERQNKTVPAMIVALTAHATREIAHQALQAGCDLYVTKPITRNRLLEVVNHFETMHPCTSPVV